MQDHLFGSEKGRQAQDGSFYYPPDQAPTLKTTTQMQLKLNPSKTLACTSPHAPPSLVSVCLDLYRDTANR